ncbi:MarR family winged helix-turn-helix transcriptional regulator [Nesterenkonia sp. NBAIMH1]|uniref:MarR family winged helix-turn-helix transcriptional regulator n=1 Tax=Nesterenkonia sp. NBAIMH1 TaxID=2600320 RepID=UPI0011B5C5FB|nr:MarR family winged helix-turn-helix transcriptional regulator [Nesterenkonia sp. NBAIMH1]
MSAESRPEQERGRSLTGYSPKAKAWRSFFEASALMTQHIEKRLHAATGLRLTDYNLLLTLTEAPNQSLRMGELAEQMIFSPSRLSYQVKVLCEKGLVERSNSSEDKRGMTARLTPAGHEAFDAASKFHAQHIRELFHPALDDPEADQLHLIAEKLKAHLDIA